MILKMSLSAAVLILVIAAVRMPALHRLPKKTFLVLWLIPLYRLLIPFYIPLQLNLTRGSNAIKNVLAEASLPMALPNTAGISGQWAAPGIISPPLAEMVPVGLAPVTVLWLLGAAACALFILISHFRGLREYKTALPVDHELITKWLHEHPIRRKLQILQSDKLSAPLTYGIWKPVILLPKTTDWTNEPRLRYILTHEYVHIRRFDVLFKWLLAAALCLHWFNPLVWMMYMLANRDIELSCDEAVVQSLGETIKSAYALTLIALEEHKSSLLPLCSYSSKNILEERIISIMKIKKTTLTGLLLSALLVISLTAAGCSSITVKGNPLVPVSALPVQAPTPQRLILIDPGHGGRDTGAVYASLKEKDLNLKIARLLQDMLEASDIPAELTRQEDKEVSLKDRMDLANRKDAALLVSIHFENSPDASKKGTLTQYNASDNVKAYGITGQKAAQLIHGTVVQSLQGEDAGLLALPDRVKYSSLKMPVVTIDLAHLSNESDRKSLQGEKYPEQAAKALYDGIMAVLGSMSE